MATPTVKLARSAEPAEPAIVLMVATLLTGAVTGLALRFPDMAGLLYPQLQNIDFRRTATRLEVPVFLMQGRHELTARAGPALEWFDRLQAPIKRMFWFESSGHNADGGEPERFNDLMVNTVLAETYHR